MVDTVPGKVPSRRYCDGTRSPPLGEKIRLQFSSEVLSLFPESASCSGLDCWSGAE